MTNQLDLFSTSPSEPTVAQAVAERASQDQRRQAWEAPVVVGTVADEKGRTSRLREAVLALLKAQISATNHELEEVGGNRFSARIYELRKEGHQIDIVMRDKKSGITVYRYREGT